MNLITSCLNNQLFLAGSVVDVTLLSDIIIILGLAVLIVLVFQKLKLPAILGFLITGMIVGPHGLNLISAIQEVEVLAEIGIIFLLFVIGIEFSLKGLASIKRTVLVGGSIQVFGTIGIVTLISYWGGMSIQSAVFMGFLLSLSSTAIVLKMLQERGELTSPHGRVSVGILIFQDIVVVLMILLIPLLAGQMENPGRTLLILGVKMIVIVAAVYILARYIVPVLFRLVVKTKSKELFILTIVVLCFATALLTSVAGLSLALGAFFAGLIISESEYSHQANANILPFREIFISFFFVSVGMLLDLNFFLDNILYIHLAAVGVAVVKMSIIALAVYLLRYPPKTTVLSCLTLFQVGEFAFVLSAAGMNYDLLSDTMYQYFLAISIITMGATPFMMKWSSGIAAFLLDIPMPKPVKRGLKAMSRSADIPAPDEEMDFHDHVVIVGYGINGQNVAKAARKANISYVVVELDPDMIQQAKANQEHVVYGDATNEEILKYVKTQKSRVVVIAISDPEATLQIVQAIRMYTETSYIIVRTRYVREVEALIKLGADEVIPEEFETSIEIFTRVMNKYLIPKNEVEFFINDLRSRNYETFRKIVSGDDRNIATLQIPDMEIATLPVYQGNNKIVGKTIGESGIRSNFGVTVLAIKRGEEYLMDIDIDHKIEQDDILYIFGPPDRIVEINDFCMLN